ncbi:MAG: preprotein translocase subunit SecY [Clostridia bacterium]|nr:preprotein translocase subunit SecY [Clostridia bacterium]MBQ6883674.1 preprotein translocase subunit SecY [Clostridia bacterium]
MFKTLVNAFKVKEIRNKILITLLFVLIYRLGCYIPVPGLGSGLLSDETLQNISYLNIMSMMSGGALSQGTWFAMGIGPYINASIIIQLLTVAIPALERMSKEGEAGQKKISNLTRIGALVLAVLQAIGILTAYSPYTETSSAADVPALLTILWNQKWLVYVILVIFYASGTLVTVWLGERITENGVTNGISILIFVGILTSVGIQSLSMLQTIFTGAEAWARTLWQFIGFIAVIVVVFGLIVFVELSERKIPVQYAKQVKGRKLYGGQSTVIPIKVNASGVMPLIFAFSLLSFPELIGSMVKGGNNNFVLWWQKWMGTDSWLYTIVLCLLILGFAFFYAQIQFNPDDISKTIQQNGGFIPGIRPGRSTADYLRRVQNRITLFGAIFLAFIALVPAILFKTVLQTSSSVFGATSLIICVSVALEFNTALESQIMMKNYKGFLK